MHRYKLFLWLMMIVLFYSSCHKRSSTPSLSGYTLQQDVAYGSDALQKMDIYLPDNRNTATTKTFVIIHGGAWIGGDKSGMNFMIDSFMRRFPGYAFINLNYRLAYNSNVNIFPAQENDVKAAIEFYINQSPSYHVAKKLILLGTSAGGHLAMLHGYKNDPLKYVAAVVDAFGPVDLAAAWNDGAAQQSMLYQAIGKTYPADSTMYYQSSPINFINPQSPPTIALQGGADNTVYPSQTNLLIAKLTANGIPNHLEFYPTEGHGWDGATLTDSYNKVQAFITAHVR